MMLEKKGLQEGVKRGEKNCIIFLNSFCSSAEGRQMSQRIMSDKNFREEMLKKA